MQRQHIRILKASTVCLIAVCMIVIGTWNLFPEANSKTLDRASQERVSEEELSAAIEAHPGVTIVTMPLHGYNIPAKSQSQSNKLEVEALVLTPQGFDRTEVTRQKGKFLLVIKSRLGLYEPSLELSRLVENRPIEKLKANVIKKEQPSWVEELDLQPGEYVVNETGKSIWSCRLRITQ
jgi:hypothetical protein